MSDNVKPYTSEELRLHRTADDTPSRLRATVEALERVTKERDEAQSAQMHNANTAVRNANERDAALAACAEMRAALSKHCSGSVEIPCTMCHDSTWDHSCDDRTVDCGHGCLRALSSDAGRGWVSPEAFDAALREVAEGFCVVGSKCTTCERIIAASKAKHGGGR